MVGSVLQDVRFAVRSLRRQPGFTATALASIGLGIAATAAVLAVASAVYLRPLPYPDSSRLVRLWQDLRGVNPYWTVTGGNFTEWKRRGDSFEAMAAFNIDRAAVEVDVGTEWLRSSIVTPDFFRVLGVGPVVGTGFRPEHGIPGNDDVVILDYGLWQQRFGGDPDAVGQSIVIGGRPYTILGVMPADFRHPESIASYASPRLWRPLALGEEAHDFYHKYLRVIGRLEPGVPFERARVEMETIARTLEREIPEFNEGYGVTMVPLRDDLLGRASLPARLLLAAGGFVLLLVVVNMAGLSVLRSQQRLPEFALRAALGASRARVGRQVLTETLLLAGTGAALGIGLTAMLSDVLQALVVRYLGSAAQLDMGGTSLLLTVGTAALAGLAFGAAPTLLAARPDLRAWLTSGLTGSGGARGALRTREAFMAAALAVTVVALFSAALTTRSFMRLVGTDPGFDVENVLTLRIMPPEDPYGDEARRRVVQGALLEELGDLPGVESAASSQDLPFGPYNHNTSVGLPGATEEEMIASEWKAVSDGYFDLLGIPILEGTTAMEAAGTRATVVVNASLAARLWPGASPVGKRLLWRSDTLDIRVAGLVDDVLDDGFDSTAEPRLYAPAALQPYRWVYYLLRTAGDGEGATDLAREAVARVDPSIAVTDIRPMSDIVGGTVAGRRTIALGLVVFAGLALLLAGVGIYGVASYNVVMRRHELGVRAALGAGRKALRRMVLWGALRVAAVGLLGGVVLSVPAARLLEATLFGIGPSDPVSYGLVAVLLGATTLLASLVPARRATEVDPVEAMRVH